MQLKDINFVGARNTRATHELGAPDVTIALHSSIDEYGVRFRNNVFNKFVGISAVPRVVIGVVGNRMYFKTGTNGYKLTAYSKDRTACGISVTSCDLKDFIGDYAIKFDRECSLYYIEREA